MSPLVSWWAALTLPSSERATWRRPLIWLAVLDTLVALCLFVTWRGEPNKPSASPRIGVQLVVPENQSRVLVDSVAPSSPADAAGIRAGDRIAQVDDEVIVSSAQLIRVIGETPAGGVRQVRIERDAKESVLPVVPSAHAPNARRSAQPLFARSQRERTEVRPRDLVPTISMSLALGALVVWAKWHRQSVRGALLVGMAIFAWMGATLLSNWALQAWLGASVGTALATLLVASLVLGIAGALALRLSPPAMSSPPAPMPMPSAFARGLFYCFAFAFRVGIVASALALLFNLPNQSASEAFGIGGNWGAGGIALFLTAGVLIAPAAEELVFRGVLLPWLRSWTSEPQAVIGSALVFAAGHLYYGASAAITLVYGVVLGWMRLRTGSLRAGIALHMALNAIATLGALAASR